MILRRRDSGALQRPHKNPDGSVSFDARVARTGAHDYGDHHEYRDAAELHRIANQLVGQPVVLNHPPTMISDGDDAPIVGKVERAWVDGTHAVATMRITDANAIAAIDRGVREISLGYFAEVDARGNHRNTRLDHVAIVEAARCGPTCAIRVDAKPRRDCACTKSSMPTTKKPTPDLMADALARQDARNEMLWQTPGYRPAMPPRSMHAHAPAGLHRDSIATMPSHAALVRRDRSLDDVVQKDPNDLDTQALLGSNTGMGGHGSASPLDFSVAFATAQNDVRAMKSLAMGIGAFPLTDNGLRDAVNSVSSALRQLGCDAAAQRLIEAWAARLGLVVPPDPAGPIAAGGAK